MELVKDFDINFVMECNNTIYYVNTYSLDIEECDTIVIRVYDNEDCLEEHEYGNGLWIDSDKGIIAGNDEILGIEEEIESIIIDRAFEEIEKEMLDI